MLDFVYVFLIFLEIILTYVLIVKILKCEKKVAELNQKVIEIGEIITVVHKNLQNTIIKVNRVVSFLTNKRFIQIRKIISLSIDIIQIIILVRSLNLSKGLKSINYKNLKKVVLTQAARKVLVSFIKNFEKLASV